MRVLIFALVILLISCSRISNSKLPDLQLGKSNLSQKIEFKKLTKGVSFFKIKRGENSNMNFYTLSSGVISKRKEIELINKLKNLNYSPRTEIPVEKGPHEESLGNIVRVGKYLSIYHAKKIEKELKDRGIHMSLRHTAEDGNSTSGPFDISVLEIDLNKFKGNIFSGLGKDQVKGKEQTSLIAKRHNAIAAVNAGFFAWKNAVGVDGEPAGISIIDGELVSEATNGRAALIIDNNYPKRVSIAHNVRTKIKLLIKDKVFKINGVNREPGKILNCGNQTDSTSVIPIHDYVCRNPNEIIVFNNHFGENSVSGSGLEFFINKKGKIVSKHHSRGRKIPKEGYLVQATGVFAKQLENLIQNEISATVKVEILSDEGIVDLKKGIYAINGGPVLLHNGNIDLSARYKEGFETQFNKDFKISDEYVDKKDKASITDDKLNNRNGFYHGWVIRRHPRTAIGITNENKVYIAVIYGRQPGSTAGASITEMVKLMQSLGCQEAFNLDGGGSSMMVVNGHKTGKSSDLDGERAVGDAIVITD